MPRICLPSFRGLNHEKNEQGRVLRWRSDAGGLPGSGLTTLTKGGGGGMRGGQGS